MQRVTIQPLKFSKRLGRTSIQMKVRPSYERIDTPKRLFTSKEWIKCVKKHSSKVSMDGKGRAIDNIYIERLWRSVKHEYIYLNPAKDGVALYTGLKEWFNYYNHNRRHQGIERELPVNRYRKAA